MRKMGPFGVKLLTGRGLACLNRASIGSSSFEGGRAIRFALKGKNFA